MVKDKTNYTKLKSVYLRAMSSESQEQKKLFEWAGLMQGTYPELSLLYASANGGKRDIVTAVKLKAEGVRAGVPDICLPAARASYHGLYIELKVGNNKPTEMQKWWIARLREQGFAVALCYGAAEAIDAITAYLNGAKPPTQQELQEYAAWKHCRSGKLKIESGK